MPRITVPEADAVIDKPINVLNHGHVTLKDYLGGDAMIVKAARVSYGSGQKTPAEDKGLINYLLAHRHTSPFEQVVLTFHCKMPIFVARQMVRHRTARLNEVSGRYTKLADEFFMPDTDQLRTQSKTNKQGSEGVIEHATAMKIRISMAKDQKDVYENYETYIEEGVAKEMARLNLPVSTYTEWYWQMDLHNLMHFLSLRMDAHAQYEIRVYADAMYELAKKVAPWAIEAFDKHVLQGGHFSGPEMDLLRKYLDVATKSDMVVSSGLTPDILKKELGSDRAVDEFLAKIGKS